MASTTDWDEIKRLAADFQKAQLSSTIQRLSERNCIEIVTKLIELKLIDVIFTTDGKEYLTAQQLVREIKDELLFHGGRINIVDLAKELNVDLNQINSCVPEITKGKEVQMVSGYLIAHYYLEKVAREINEKLQLQGQISVGELSLQYDLPAELLQNVLERYLGKIIIGRQDSSDPRTFYTEDYINRTKAKITGALLGLLKPTPVAVIINHCNLSDRLFTSLFDQLSAPGVLTGRQAGALYVPSCYTKSQTDWVLSFYRQNNYLEYDAMTRLGISDPKGFVKRVLPNEQLIYLSSCVIGIQIQQQLETALEECIASKSYLDVVSLLPSIFSDADIEKMLENLLKSNSKSVILFENTVFSHHYLEGLKSACSTITKKNAENMVKSGQYQQYCLEKQLANKMGDTAQNSHIDHKAERKEERRKKATSGKGGGGAQGRETKTKAVKKHTRSSKQANNDSDSDESSNVVKKNQTDLEIVTNDDIVAVIKPTLESEALEDLVDNIAEYLHGILNPLGLSMAKELADKLMQDANQSRKQTHSSAQDIINILVNDIKLYEKGLKTFSADQQPQFIKYLIKSLGADVLSELCKYAANQCNFNVNDGPLTPDQRNKIVNDLPEVYMKPLKALNATINEQNLELFYQAVDVCLSAFEMILKKIDKKKDKILVLNHREKLLSELEACEDPAVALHIASLVIYTILTHNMIHASGRQVPTVIAYLKTLLKEEDFKLLQSYHELVTKYLIGSGDEKAEIENILKERLPEIKKLAIDVKKYK